MQEIGQMHIKRKQGVYTWLKNKKNANAQIALKQEELNSIVKFAKNSAHHAGIILMPAHMRGHHTDTQKCFCVVVNLHNSKKSYNIPLSHHKDLEKVLEKYSEEDDDTPVSWEILAKERIEKYKKSGLVLRGMRYREGFSQKLLAEESGITQNEISNIENGKRTVGKKVAEKLAKALNFDYRMLLD